MSLISAFNTAQLGLALTEKKITVVAGNVNNADKAGYTRQLYQSNYINTGAGTLPVGGTVVQAVSDPLLAKQANQQFTAYTNQNTKSTYLTGYSASYGGTGADAATISTQLGDLTTSLRALESNPQTVAAKSQVVAIAQQLASQLNALSQGIQTQRLNANNDITTSVNTINNDLQTISKLNTQISIAQNSGQGTADLEDARNAAAQELSSQLGVQYFSNASNEMIVYTNTGTQLVGNVNASTVAYNPVGTVTSGTVYPGGFGGITVNGVDITSSLTTGQLGALVSLRDSILPGEQAKLDTYANKLQTTVNSALSTGTAVPSLNSVISSKVVTAGTAFSATGNFRVAVTDSTGAVVQTADLNLASYSTVGALITGLNTISGVNASINSNGNLVIKSTAAADGISLNPLNSSVGGINASEFFGFNDLFVNVSNNGASGIGINSQLTNNSAGLATATLSASGTLAIGDNGVSSGDVSAISAVLNAFAGTQSFSAAGDFGAQTATLADYAGAIISDAAVQAKTAQTNANTASATYTYLSTNLANETGVNVDEETANMTALQTAYQANAQIISTVRSMFSALLQAIQ